VLPESSSGRSDLPVGVGARFCASCGRPLIPGTQFCPTCGAAVAGSVPSAPLAGATPTAAPFVAPGYAPYGAGFPSPGASPPPFGPTDREALGYVVTASLVGLIGALISLVTLFTSRTGSVVSSITTSSTGTSVTIDAGAFYALLVVGAAGVVLSLLEVWMYRQAFRRLAPIDARFTTPTSLVLILFVGLIGITVVGAALAAQLAAAISCAGSNPLTSACLSFGLLLLLLGLLGALAIAAFVGYIGMLIGIWRLGTRYDDGLFKVGAVLLFIPLLNVVGTILILVAARSLRERPHGVTPMGTFG